MTKKKRITVFTPTYNRAHTIHRTYTSLCKQSNNNFIWLIIDDGSTDGSRELIDEWIKQEKIEIKYIYKKNGGMHSAHNVAYKNIDTELNICIDSDDLLASDAIEKILGYWDMYGTNAYAGLIGLDATTDGNIIGNKLPNNIIEITLSDYYANGGKGDKKLVYRTDVIKKYPDYPEFVNEKLVPLGVKYTLIDQDYKLLILNDILCFVEYQPNGSSNTIFRQYKESPKGFSYVRKINMIYGKTLIKRIVSAVHYVSSSIFEKNRSFLSESPNKSITILCLIPGVLLHIFIQIVILSQQRRKDKQVIKL